jgi:hypothetical protein
MKAPLAALLALGAACSTGDAATAAPPSTAADAAPAATPTPAPDAAPAPPRIDRSLSEGVVPFGDIELQLELGRWTVGDVDALLADAQARFPEPGARLAFLMEHFRGTAFEYESQSDIPPPGRLRVRLRSFGCTGFAIYMLAMTDAASFEELVHNLRKIRYWETETRGVDSDPATGNILDFAYEVFVDSAVRHGYAVDVTAEVAGGAPLTTFRTRFSARTRTEEYDKGRRRIVSKVHQGAVVEAKMISRATFRAMDRSTIKTGDILLFSRVDPGKPAGDELMVGHLAIAVNRGGEIYMMHATRDYVWRPDATAGSPKHATGHYYKNDPRREQLGVTMATTWVDDPAGRQMLLDGKPYYGYHPEELRPVHDYIVGAHIQGIMVLRPTALSAETVTGHHRFLAAAQEARRAADALAAMPPIVDSRMTRDEAVLHHLPAGCPPAIVARQKLVDVEYVGFDGRRHVGQLVVDEALVDDVQAVFAVMRETRYPVTSVIPIAAAPFDWSDDASMDANNTSGFNYRPVTGTSVLSNHACGLAIDLNPRINPYIRGSVVQPAGAVYDPTKPGTLTADHPVVKAFKARGWTWGGDFKQLKDYQHFEKGQCRR